MSSAASSTFPAATSRPRGRGTRRIASATNRGNAMRESGTGVARWRYHAAQHSARVGVSENDVYLSFEMTPFVVRSADSWSSGRSCSASMEDMHQETPRCVRQWISKPAQAHRPVQVLLISQPVSIGTAGVAEQLPPSGARRAWSVSASQRPPVASFLDAHTTRWPSLTRGLEFATSAAAAVVRQLGRQSSMSQWNGRTIEQDIQFIQRASRAFVRHQA